MRFSTALKPTYEELQQKVKMLEGEVSDLKKVEDARLEIEKQLIDIQRIACTGIWVWDLQTGKVEWSHEVFRIFGLDPKSFKPDIDSIMSRFPKDEQDIHN